MLLFFEIPTAIFLSVKLVPALRDTAACPPMDRDFESFATAQEIRSVLILRAVQRISEANVLFKNIADSFIQRRQMFHDTR